ncbi:MAG: TonB-dependent receptor [Vicinamibacterales bacterium]
MRDLLLLTLVLFFWITSTPALAQFSTGRIDVVVTDATAALAPGALVQIEGPENRTANADASGQAHFLNLTPGNYTARVALQGFNDYINRNVPVAAGTGVSLRVVLTVAGVTQSVAISAATPMIDPRRAAIATTVTYAELQSVPSARDPWVVLQTVPGVIVDRVNVGGSESGQQSNYLAKGADRGQNTWNIDGVPVTDMAALGASPTYFDFDMFEEMQITTGGADIKSPTPGVAVNLVLKAGTNTPRGSSRYYFTNESLQAVNLPSDLAASLGGPSRKGNRMQTYHDYGFELGGPILRDRLWAWGAAGRTDVAVLTLTGTSDATDLANLALKMSGQATGSLRPSLTVFRGNKQKQGRDASPLRPEETTFNQDGPTTMVKVGASYAAGGQVFLTGHWATVSGGFALTPQGGLEVNMIGADDAGRARNTFYAYRTDRPQHGGELQGSYFRGRHELRAGVHHRRAEVDETYTVPGNGIITYHRGYPAMIAEVSAWNQVTGASARYTGAFVGDTVAFDRWTLSAGLRWDRQAASVRSYSQAGNSLLASLLPDLTGRAADQAIVWNALTPRLAVSYAAGKSRRTVARASYAAFASQMGADEAAFFSTVGSRRGVFFFDVTDQNLNRTVDHEEIAGRTCSPALADRGVCAWYGFDLANPSNAGEPNHRIARYSTPITHELSGGIDHELRSNIALRATLTWRRFVDFNWRPLQGVRGDDFVRLGSFSGRVEPIGDFEVPFYGLPADAVPANRTATEYVTREDYHQRYWGIEIAAIKRLSNRWMGRAGFSANDHREYFETAGALFDPTSTPDSPNIDGGEVLRETAGSGKTNIFMLLPKYQVSAAAMYQAPWKISLAANLLVRQGYAKPYYRSGVPTGDPLGDLKTLLLVSPGEFRLAPVTSLDGRASRAFTIERLRLNVDVDVFNVLNLATVLRRQYDLRVTTADTPLEIMAPAILRLGIRAGF